MIESIRDHAQLHRAPYEGSAVQIKGHPLPSDYLEVLRHSNGFVTHDGLFRLFSIGQDGLYDACARNASEWAHAYGSLLDGFVIIAEDIFGDMYGYLFTNETKPKLSKFYCEGGEIEICDPQSLPAFLATRVLRSSPTAFDTVLARLALRQGLVPTVDQHLSFTVPLISGGDYVPENLGVECTELHLGVLGQMSLAHAGLPDGSGIAGFTDDSRRSR